MDRAAADVTSAGAVAVRSPEDFPAYGSAFRRSSIFTVNSSAGVKNCAVSVEIALAFVCVVLERWIARTTSRSVVAIVCCAINFVAGIIAFSISCMRLIRRKKFNCVDGLHLLYSVVALCVACMEFWRAVGWFSEYFPSSWFTVAVPLYISIAILTLLVVEAAIMGLIRNGIKKFYLNLIILAFLLGMALCITVTGIPPKQAAAVPVAPDGVHLTRVLLAKESVTGASVLPAYPQKRQFVLHNLPKGQFVPTSRIVLKGSFKTTIFNSGFKAGAHFNSTIMNIDSLVVSGASPVPAVLPAGGYYISNTTNPNVDSGASPVPAVLPAGGYYISNTTNPNVDSDL